MTSTEPQTSCSVSTDRGQNMNGVGDDQTTVPSSGSFMSDTDHASEDSTRNHSKFHTMEYITLIWLDSEIEMSKKHIENSISRLQHLVNLVKVFTDLEDCTNFIVSNMIKRFFYLFRVISVSESH
jgi:hypothetical protein